MLRKVPLIVILGSTGTGKTKLSIELAERFNGEIISADSMQVYADLDIVTAKATKEEQSKVAHHLLDVASPAEPFTVVQFRNTALPVIDHLLSQSKCPVVVGGTNYYIESLLWDVLVSKLSPEGIAQTPPKNIVELDLESLPSSKLYEQLREIDSLTAERIHPNNKRKIMRALEVYTQTGVPLSEILKEQRNRPGGNRLGGPLRYPHTILLWLQCNQDVLNERLDRRIDSMLQQGLLHEVRTFYDKNKNISSEESFTQGILQSIGFKEFVPYLEKYDMNQDSLIDQYLKSKSYMLTEEKTVDEPHGLDLLRSCLEELKLITRRYSKKQKKWVQNRFLGSKNRQVPAVYSLDTSNIDLWNSNVRLSAIEIVQSYMNDIDSSHTPLKPVEHPGAGLNEEVSNYCEVCQRHFVGEFQWNSHLKSNKHKRIKEGKRRREKQQKV